MATQHTNSHVEQLSSLFNMAKRQIIRNIDMLEDVGDVPYPLLRPILLRVENPVQLHKIEERSPHIAEQDGEIWLGFIKRDIQNWDQKPHKPRNPKSWWKVYRKLKREDEEEAEKQKEKLKAALAALRDEQESSATKVTNKLVDPGRRKARPTTNAHSRTAPYPRIQASGGKKLPTMTGKGMLAQAKKEVKEAARQRQSILATPSHLLHTVGRKPKAAPKDWMERMMPVSEAQGPDQLLKPPRVSAPTRSVAIHPIRREGRTSSDDLAAREARLKALKGGGVAPLVPSTSTASKIRTTYDVSLSNLTTDAAHVSAMTSSNRSASARLPATNQSSPFSSLSLKVVGDKRKKDSNCFMPAKRR